MIEIDKMNDEKYRQEKEKHIRTLKKMIQRGHKHPEIEGD